VVGAHAGEFMADQLAAFVDGLISDARTKGGLSNEEFHFKAEPPTISPGALKYPGKVAVSGNRIAISDSGHGRVIIGTVNDDSSHVTIDRIAEGFQSPQGLAFNNDEVIVADAEGHSVRSIDLATGGVSTIAGTGKQLRTRLDQREGAMSSPWDVVVDGHLIHVAMAGIHQLWTVDRISGKSRVHSGTGAEAIMDGPSASAVLAQPMGIAQHGDKLFFADAESNGVRWADASGEGNVGTIVGTGLFDFGNVDGIGDDVRLQHPQGIAVMPDGGLLVADSYNDCIKLIDVSSRSSTTWLRGLHEPEGIACGDSHAFIADTNAHRILSVDLGSREMRELTIE
jgi:DNA-binding beta-propeller fold protein YncE